MTNNERSPLLAAARSSKRIEDARSSSISSFVVISFLLATIIFTRELHGLVIQRNNGDGSYMMHLMASSPQRSHQNDDDAADHPTIIGWPHTNQNIRPGTTFLSVTGEPINAHGGGFLYYLGTYYWYGEIKIGPTYLPSSNAGWGGTRVDLTGISCYSSLDLLNWEYRGNVLPAVTDDADHDLYINQVAERPKVIYNANTGKFVMWLHIDSMDYSKARCGVAVSDSPDGPFEFMKSFRPQGQLARDLTVFVDHDKEGLNDKAYLFTSSEDNAVMHVSQLSDDYLSTIGNYSRIFAGRYMEAPTVFKHEGMYYFIGSGCTAWKPNAARSAVASSIWGPWVELGNPCRGEGANTTFDSQSTYVLPVSGGGGGSSDHFVFVADRWNEKNLSDSRYIWLPLEFDEENGSPIIQWRDEWSPMNAWPTSKSMND